MPIENGSEEFEFQIFKHNSHEGDIIFDNFNLKVKDYMELLKDQTMHEM